MRIALAQTDVSVGQVTSNAAHARDTIAEAASQEADLVVFPELSMNGYALGQLNTDQYLDQCLTADDERLTALSSKGPDVVLGFHEDGGVRTYNSASYLANGQLLHLHRKLAQLPDMGRTQACQPRPGHAGVQHLLGSCGHPDLQRRLATCVAVASGPRRRGNSLHPHQQRRRHWTRVTGHHPVLGPTAALHRANAAILGCLRQSGRNRSRRPLLGRLARHRPQRQCGGPSSNVGTSANRHRHRRVRSAPSTKGSAAHCRSSSRAHRAGSSTSHR